MIRLVEGDRFPVGELDGERSERVKCHRFDPDRSGLHVQSRYRHPIARMGEGVGNLAFNPISALVGATLAEICRFPPTRALAAKVMGEAAEVAERLGLHLRVSIDQRIDGQRGSGTTRLRCFRILRPVAC